MSKGHVVNLHLELLADADPIAGRARGECGPDRHFSGWMELTSVIELAVEQAARRRPRGRSVGKPEPPD